MLCEIPFGCQAILGQTDFFLFFTNCFLFANMTQDTSEYHQQLRSRNCGTRKCGNTVICASRQSPHGTRQLYTFLSYDRYRALVLKQSPGHSDSLFSQFATLLKGFHYFSFCFTDFVPLAMYLPVALLWAETEWPPTVSGFLFLCRVLWQVPWNVSPWVHSTFPHRAKRQLMADYLVTLLLSGCKKCYRSKITQIPCKVSRTSTHPFWGKNNNKTPTIPTLKPT